VFKRSYQVRTEWWRIPLEESSYDRFVSINTRGYGRYTVSFFPENHNTRQIRNREEHNGIYEEVEGKNYFFIVSQIMYF
jgi:hypothetical protein